MCKQSSILKIVLLRKSSFPTCITMNTHLCYLNLIMEVKCICRIYYLWTCAFQTDKLTQTLNEEHFLFNHVEENV